MQLRSAVKAAAGGRGGDHAIAALPMPLPDANAYNVVLGGLVKAGRVGEVFALFEKMRRGTAAAPDAITYNTVIAAHARARDVEGAVGVFEAFVAASEKQGGGKAPQPDTFTLGALMHACERAGDGARAAKMLKTLPKQFPHARPNEVAIASAISACGRDAVQGVEVAERLFRDISRKWNLVPNAICYNALITAHARRVFVAGKEEATAERLQKNEEHLQRAVELFEELKSQGGAKSADGPAVKPLVSSYNAVLDALARGGEVDAVMARFLEMKRLAARAGNAETPPIAPDATTYNTVLDALVRGGRRSAARSVLGEAMAGGIYKNDRASLNETTGVLELDLHRAGGEHVSAARACLRKR